MKAFWSRSRPGKAVEAGLHLLETAIGVGLISGAAVVSALGNILLGALLAAIALGIFVRLARRKRKTQRARSANPPAACRDG